MAKNAMPLRTSERPSLWCATSASQLAAIASTGWRDWPDATLQTTSSLDDAVAVARGLAQTQGEGHVVRLDVTSELLQRYPGGNVPFVARGDLVASLQHAVTEHAFFRGTVSDDEVAAAQAALGRTIPATWRSYVQGACWFHRGWMRGGAYVSLYPPSSSAELSFHDQCPEMFVIGGDGAGEQLVVDLREHDPRVLLANVVCSGWEETLVQAESLASFLTEIEAGTFKFSFE